jgi:hypothetical protein
MYIILNYYEYVTQYPLLKSVEGTVITFELKFFRSKLLSGIEVVSVLTHHYMNTHEEVEITLHTFLNPGTVWR